MRRLVIVLAALLMIGGYATQVAAQNPYNINGVVPDAGVTATSDPHGNVKELGPVNGSSTKIGVINTAAPPMLEFTNPNGQVDLGTIYLGTQQALNGDQWLYFGWNRPDSNTGSGFISIEFQQEGLSPSCVYTGVDFTNKNDPETVALIANCNPWRNRKSGDFIITWDQQGNGLAFDDIKKRVFTCTDTAAPRTCTLGPIQDLGTVEAAVSADRFSGEMAINLTTEVFGQTQACLTFANVLPGTVTGNSDSADYKDTVFAEFPPITNCGILKVSKVTLDPDGVSFSDPANPAFGYTVTKSGDALRYNSDAANHPVDGPAAQTQIVRPNSNTPAGPAIHGGETQTHTDLIPGSNYTLVEATPLPTPYQLVSIICTDAGGAHNITASGTYAVSIPSGAFQFTSCVITNQFVRTTPSLATVQSATVRLFDSVTITGLTPTPAASRASTATFRLYSDNTCSTQVGSDVPVTLSYNGAGTSATANTLGTTGILVNVPAGGATYWWRVSFPGDSFNNAVTTACGLETTGILITFVDSGS